ncbi:hypothetical protein [Photobacterium atrarenae]|uniref:Uncharacterized protein n=1 Tax=Photobacterium atrarenae TaxID=865757 RepID=A0ABY5GC99_9GAMM|nr:hypothetical protein [Photobacterium atrarenae]UTV26471.1 hypothetical protein NNL38_08775 [Photobacterium atrarenae]
MVGGYVSSLAPGKKAFSNVDLKPDVTDAIRRTDVADRKTLDDFPEFNALNHKKAAVGEYNAHALMMENGFTPLGKTDGVYKPGSNGIDGIYRHPNPPPDFVITEAKYNKARLGKTKDGKQMSNDWLTHERLQEAGLSRKEIRKIRDGLDFADGSVEKYLIRNKPDGALVVKRLDKRANIASKALDLESELGL